MSHPDHVQQLLDRITIRDRSGRWVQAAGVVVDDAFQVESWVGPASRVRLNVTVEGGIPLVGSVKVDRVRRAEEPLEGGVAGTRVRHEPARGEVTSRILRSIPIAQLVDDALRLYGYFSTSQEEWDAFPVGPDDAEILRDQHMDRVDESIGRRRRRSRTDEAVRQAAEVYASAYRDGRAPTEAVRLHLGGASARTAREWVAEARRRGFLPPTTRGKALA